MSPSSCLDAALSYAQRGWRVVALHTPTPSGACSCGAWPCDSPGKHPRWHRELLPSGLKNATTDADTIRAWWQRWPDANVGIATGEESGLYVLDSDWDKGGDVALIELQHEAEFLPPTARVRTGGGEHYYFAHPGGGWPNTAGNVDQGIDTRGDGGYVVAPPSLHASGVRYTWLDARGEPIAEPDCDLAALPGWVRTILREEAAAATPAPRATAQPGVAMRDYSAYAQQALADELAQLARTTTGGRNNALNRAAFNLGQLVGAGLLDETAIAQALGGVALGIGLKPREIEATLRSGLRDGIATPRDLSTIPDRPAPAPTRAPRQQAADGAAAAPDDAAPGNERPAPHLTDYGNAQRLIAQHGADLRYVAEWGWMVWDGHRWQLDERGETQRRAKATALGIEDEIAEEVDDDVAKKILAFARSSENRARLESMIAVAQSEPGVPLASDAFDAHDWRLNVANGTLDLHTGELGPHVRGDLITKQAAVAYDPAAQCPQWLAFLDTIMASNAAMIGYLQRAIGYALTGSTGEQVMFFMYGTGANGKSTFLEVLRALLGDYGRQTDPTTFLARQNNDRIPNDIARLAGARFVSAVEVDEGRRLSEVLIKQIISGDTLTARFLNREFFEFKARFKLFLAANHKPVIRGTDEGIWRRIRLIPFAVTIPKEQRDRGLLDKLLGELEGILAWAVQGCLEWQRGGLQEPPEVLLATEGYRVEMDIVGAFISDSCVRQSGARASCDTLYKTYQQWCEDNGEFCMSQRRFGQQVEERGFERVRGAQGKWFRAGLGLLDERTDGADSGDSAEPVTQVTQGDPTNGGRRMLEESFSDSEDPGIMDHLASLRSPKEESESEGGEDSPTSGAPSAGDVRRQEGDQRHNARIIELIGRALDGDRIQKALSLVGQLRGVAARTEQAARVKAAAEGGGA